MDLLYKSLKIERNKRIYHVNADEYRLKRIIKKHIDKKSDVLYFHQENRMNIDIVFISNSYISPKEDGNERLITLKDHYREDHALLQVFFGSYSLLTAFYKEKKRNPNVFMCFNTVLHGAFFKSLEKKSFYINSCFVNDNNIIIKTPYQFCMFTTTAKQEKLLEAAKEELRESESLLLNLMS